ncbi:MAG: hypothetical protein AcusKO_27110 [Acuticoccus sp.]
MTLADAPAAAKAAPVPAIAARHDVVFADPALYAAHPHLAMAGDGTWLLVFNVAPRREVVLHPPLDPAFRNVVMRSRDAGRTWSAPVPVPDADTTGVECAGLTALADGGVLLNQWQFGWRPPEDCDPADPTLALPPALASGWAASAEFAGLHACPAPETLFPLARCGGRTLVSRAETGHAPFRPVAPLDVAPFPGGYGMRGGVPLADGGILLPLSDVPHYARVFVVRLDAAGRQRGAPVLAAAHPDAEFEEPCPVRLADGTILLILRDNRSRHLHTVRSADEGATWSAPQRLPIGDYPASLAPLPDGQLALVAGRRRAPYGITLHLGDASGTHWRGPFAIRDDLPDRDLGYPAALLDGRGALVAIYYGRTPHGVTAILSSIVDGPTLQRLADDHGPG